MERSQAKQIQDAPGYWIYPDGSVWSEKSNKFMRHTAGGYKGKYRKYMLFVNKKKLVLL